MPSKKKPDPYAQQAQAQATVRYGPELSALTALLQAAQTSYGDRVRAAKSARLMSTRAVDQAQPMVQGAYQGAGQTVAPAFASGGGIEAQALTARLGEAQALAQSQLAARRVSAVEGEGAARDQALRDYRSDRDKIGTRSTDLAREIGAFQTETRGELKGAADAALAQQQELAARLTQSERNSIRSSGIDPDTGAPIPGGKLDPATKKKDGKSPWASQTAQSAAADEIQRLLKEAQANRAAGESRGDTADFLLTGAPSAGEKKVPVYETVNGKRQPKLNKDGTPVYKTSPADPGFDAAKSQLLASAALDMAYDGHLSRRNQKLLHDRGIQLAPLGLVTYQEWLKRQRRGPAQPKNRAVPDPLTGQSRPT